MKILLAHTYYQQPGGEDQSFAAEARMLAERGHEVERFELRNEALEGMNKLEAAARTVWNWSVARELKRVVARFRPEVVHFTNTFPLISPAAYSAARSRGAAVVQSLRNYRQLCPSALLLRDGKVCEDCLGKWFAWPGVKHGCYRGSRAATAVVAGMTAIHSALGTWSRKVDLYFTLTEFARGRFVAAGWPAERIVVKPNFLDQDPGPGDGRGGYAVFVGRLSEEKGLSVLLDAWQTPGAKPPLKIIGQGPLEGEIDRRLANLPSVERLGHRSSAETLEIIGAASCLIMPSIWYETFGRTIMEAYAKGTPVIVSKLGAMAELVRDGETGLLFPAGDAAKLAEGVARFAAEPELQIRMRTVARREFLDRYTADRNHDLLLDVYRTALARAGGREVHRSAAAIEHL